MPSWRENAMKKIDDAGSGLNKHLRAQQETASGLGLKDRLRVAKGENVRWEATRKDADGAGGGDDDGTSAGRARAAVLPGRALPPSLPSRNGIAGGSGSVPPPPARTGAAGVRPPPPPVGAKPGAPAAAAAARGGPPPPPPRAGGPALPPRMNNEAGIDNPPPPYVGAKPGAARPVPPPRAGAAAAAAPAAGPGHIEFSKFDASDKAAFFQLLDQYFAARGANVTPAP